MSSATIASDIKVGYGLDAEQIERIINDDAKLLENMEIGDVAFQGDVLFIRLSAMPKCYQLRKTRQLAPGTTRGSRHVAERGEVFEPIDSTGRRYMGQELTAVLNRRQVQPIDLNARGSEFTAGLIYVSPADPTCDDITHPEHGNLGFPAGSVCLVGHAQVFEKEKATRVLD